MAFALPFFKQKKENHIYFGLYFTENRISGFAFDIVLGKANILSQNGYDVTSGFEKMLEDIDNLISDLELKTNLTLDKTIFFLHTSMLDENTKDIREPYKEMLKKISKELELEPMGYIDVHEAVEGKMKENSVINNILLEVSPQELAVFIYKGGILSTTSVVTRTESIPQDLSTALEALPKKIILPTKIMMYGVGNLAEYSTEISTFKWSEKIFPHHPTLEVLKDTPFNQMLADTFVDELTTQEKKPEEAISKVESSAEQLPEATFGFMMGHDVKTSSGGQTQDIQADPLDSQVPIHTQISTFMNRVSSTVLPKSGTPGKMNPNLIIAMFIGAAIVVGTFFSFEYFVHAATIEVEVQTADLSKKFDLSLPIVEKSSPKTLSIIKHIKVIEYADEKTTTGKRDVGEKAKGDIIIHNFENSEKTIERGHELSYKTLKFILDNDIKVASSSGISSDGVKQSGKAKASVTASDIGPDYNISKSSQLTIGSLSESLYIGIVDATFTGGTKKQVTTVSKADLDTLKKTVEDEVKKKAEIELSHAVPKDEFLIEDMTNIDVTDTEYSGEVGEEAKSIKITASSEIEYYTLEKDQLIQELFSKLEKEKKDNYIVDRDGFTYKITNIEENSDGETVDMTIQVSTKQYEKIDDNELKKKVTLKSASNVDSILKAAYDVQAATVKKATPSFPWLPLFIKNITIETATK